jgi:hypothetical protein
VTYEELTRELDLVQRLARAEYPRDALRAALDGLVTLFAPYLEAHDCGEGDEWCMKHLPTPADLRVALAAAKETP